MTSAAIDKLRDGPPTDRLAGWITTLTITALAFAIRIVNLGYPNKFVFDETYYAKDGYSLLKYGYERSWPENANEQILRGSLDILKDSPSFVVHPPVGKWLIALGEAMFGMNSFGWRFMACVFGSLLVLATIRLARRLSRSTLVGGIAGLLLTFDGLAFTMSRVALLDIFQAFFVVAAVACVVADRDYYRNKLATTLDNQGITTFAGFGPKIWWRPWLWAAGIFFGLAIATKWNALYVLAVFGLAAVFWSVAARRLASEKGKSWLALLWDGVPAFIALVGTSIAIYVVSWWGWFSTNGGWQRHWADTNPNHSLVKVFGPDLGSWMWYQKEIYGFHTGSYINEATHPYDAHPLGWLLMIRPIGMDAVNDIKPGSDGCVGPDTCIRVISGMGTPMLWWLAAAALVLAIVWWIRDRDWRFGVPVLAALACYLPWFQYTSRPLFFFYAVLIIPFTATALAMAFGKLLGPPSHPKRRQRAIIIGTLIGLIVVNFTFIYPILTDGLLPRLWWQARMWFPTWI